MKKSFFVLAIALFTLFAFRADEAKKPKWVSIFNGKDLSGWVVKVAGRPVGENLGNVFRVENGIMSVRYDHEAYANFNSQFGALYYNKKLKHYRLKVEYRFVGETAAGAPSWGFRDSGVQYQGQAPETVGLTQSFPVCLEYNLHGGNGKDERPTGEICANGIIVKIDGNPNSSYCTPPTVKRTFHGDQWVTLEIDVTESKISHFVNGEEILTFTDPRYNPNHELGKTFIVNGNDRVQSGYISLQSNSHPIDFRKIELMEYE